ncbi:MAG: AMIN domain-containing protein [Nitrospirae bacterium]|nr:AMIN domain-containing protein [Nitrospirota bacterium]
MKRRKWLITAGIFLFFICSCTTPRETVKNDSGDQADNPITSIEVANDSVKITASRPFQYKIMETADPYKKVIDLYDVSAGRFKDIILPGSAIVADISVKSANGLMARTVVDLTLSSIVELKDSLSSDNTLTLSFSKKPAAVNADNIPILEDEKPRQKNGRLPAGKYVTGIRVSKESDKAARVEIKGDGMLVPDVFTLNGRVVVDLPGVKMAATVPQGIAQPPLGAIRWAEHKDKVRLVLDLTDKAAYKVDLQGDKAIIILADAALAEGEKGPIQPAASSGQEKASGAPTDTASQAAPDITKTPDITKKRPITLNFNNADIISILKLIADVSGYNVVVDPRVSGKVTIKLKDVPWDRALDLLIEPHKLKKIIEGNVIKIVPGEDFHARPDVKSTQPTPIYIKDLSITFSDIGGGIKTIKRANIVADSGNICLDLNVSVDTVKPQATTPKRPVHANNTHSETKKSHAKVKKSRTAKAKK